MLTRIRNLFAAPIFPEDEEKTRAAGVLNSLILSLLLLVGAYIPANLIIFEEKFLNKLFLVGFFVVLVIIRFLLVRGKVRQGSILLGIISWILVTAFILFGGGMRSVAVVFYVAITVMTGLLLGVRSMVFIAIINCMIGLGMALADIFGVSPPRIFPIPALSGWIDMTAALFLVTMTLSIALRSLQDALLKTNHQLEERKKAEQALYASTEKIQAMFKSAIEGITFMDLEGKILDLNEATLRLHGYQDRAQVLGYDALDFVAERDRSRVRQAMQAVLKNDYMDAQEYHLLRKDGQEFDGEISAILLKNEQGHPFGFVVTTRDITERKSIREQTQRQVKRLAALRSIDTAITTSFDLNVTLDILLKEVIDQLEVDAAAIWLMSPHTQSLEYIAQRGFYRPFGFQIPQVRLGEGYTGQVAVNSQIIQIPDLRNDTSHPYPNHLEDEDFVAYLGVPIKAKGQVKGVLEIFHRALLSPKADWLDFLESLAGQAAIAIDNTELFEGLERTNLELTLAYNTTLEGWAKALEMRDVEIEDHSQRVANLTVNLGRKLGISDENLAHMYRGALLHDIGKMGIPDHILLKPGPLTDAEWEVIRLHPVYAYEMLSPIHYLRPALNIPYCHHEKWDGSGYPRGIKGTQIPLAARIFTVVDVWDALCSDRPYRPAWPIEKALAYIDEQAGIEFDPQVVEEFMQIVESNNE